jgi:photosystem II stability/assembly factor-like uncharacterized protein
MMTMKERMKDRTVDAPSSKGKGSVWFGFSVREDGRREAPPRRVLSVPGLIGGSLVLALLSGLSGGAFGQMPAPARAQWEPIGLSGGGAMFTPAISPADPKRMMVNCDMSAAYTSTDGGQHWQMINHAQLHSSTRCRPAFHPTDPDIIYAADGETGLKLSQDGGRHWKSLGNLPADLRGEIALDPGNPRDMLAGAGTGVFRSEDSGQTWTHCEGPQGDLLAFHFDLTSPIVQRICFAATSEGIWRSDDGGKTWAIKTQGLPPGPILGFSGGSNAGAHLVILYCTVPSKVVDGKFTGGIYRSLDRGDTWQSALGTGLNVETKAFDEWAMGPVAQYEHIVTNNAQPRTVYAFNSNTGIPPPHHATVYRSDDAGQTWRATFQADPRYPGCNMERDYTVAVDGQFYQDVPSVAIDANDPNYLFLVTTGECYLTTNGGKTWTCGHTHQVPGTEAAGETPRWLCNGLVVTTTWNYYIDPFEPNRHYICYTDIGFARSLDRGKTWQWWAQKGRAPWNNTCYQLAFDPQTPGLIWGAFSTIHDIPNGNIIYGNHNSRGPGGVCVSTDFGATWQPSNQGLPLAPTTSVIVDPRSPKDARVLYAGLFGVGVFKSSDNGKTWVNKSQDLGSATNRRVTRVFLHADGTLFALVTALRQNGQFQSDGVGLYRSQDGGNHWTPISRSQPLLWPKDFTVDPHDSHVLYLSGCDTNGQQTGGLYRSRDGGATWQRLARKGSEHFGAYVSPTHRGWIYMTLTEGAPGAGLWLSRDDGATWQPMEGLPFSNAQRVTFDPSDPNHIYVSTFGGSVWRGPAMEP